MVLPYVKLLAAVIDKWQAWWWLNEQAETCSHFVQDN
jgi:hypothetical protein